MIEAILVGLVVLGVSGLTVLAYNHPAKYAPIGKRVSSFLQAGMMCAAVWVFSKSVIFSTLLKFLETDQISAAQLEIDNLGPPIVWTAILLIFLIIYMSFLDLFVSTLKNKESDTESDGHDV